MIAIHRSQIEARAPQRPHGYLEAVLAKAREDAEGWLWFTEADYDALRARYSPVAAAGSNLAAYRQGLCMGCADWLNKDWPDGPKCLHPHCGCPRSELRVRPWEHMARCPAGRW